MQSVEQKERLGSYLQGIPELQDQMLMKDYFKSYHFRKEEEKMLEFWRKAIAGLYKYVYATSTLTKHKIKVSFMINRVVPYGIDNVIQELVRRGQLIPAEELKSRQYYRQKTENMGWIRWTLHKIYSGTLGYLFTSAPTIPDSTPLVSVAFMKSLWKKLVAQLHKKNEFTIASASIRRELSEIGASETTRELMLIHFEETGHLQRFNVTINGEDVDCYKVSEEMFTNRGVPYVSAKEKATLMLKLNIENISAKLETLERKILGSHDEAVKMVKLKRKEVAKYLLKQKHLFQGYWEKFAILKYQLENQVLKIDTLEANDNLVKAFKLAEAAHKSIKTDLKEVEEVLENMEMRMEEQEEIAAAVQQHGQTMLGTDDEILKELDEYGPGEETQDRKTSEGSVVKKPLPSKRSTAVTESKSPEKEEEKVAINV